MSLKEWRESPLIKTARIKTSSSSSRSNRHSPNQEPRSKYNAKKVEIDGITFDSILEGKRYCELKILVKSNEISDLRRQVPYDLIINDFKICTYKADFVYYKDGNLVVEDAKGVLTPEYKLKKKLMKAILNIDIFEFKQPKSQYKKKRK